MKTAAEDRVRYRGEWSVACAALGATSDKSIKYLFYVLLINRNVQNVYS